MTHPTSYTARLVFTSADSAHPDPAAVGSLVRTIVAGLRLEGEAITPAYTGEKGAAEVFAWMLAAATVVGPIITLTDLSLKLAQLVNEVRKLRGSDTAPHTASPVTLVIRFEQATTTVRGDAALDDQALLTQLLADRFPADVRPDELVIEVQIPPTPPNEL